MLSKCNILCCWLGRKCCGRLVATTISESPSTHPAAARRRPTLRIAMSWNNAIRAVLVVVDNGARTLGGQLFLDLCSLHPAPSVPTNVISVIQASPLADCNVGHDMNSVTGMLWKARPAMYSDTRSWYVLNLLLLVWLLGAAVGTI